MAAPPEELPRDELIAILFFALLRCCCCCCREKLFAARAVNTFWSRRASESDEFSILRAVQRPEFTAVSVDVFEDFFFLVMRGRINNIDYYESMI